MNSFFQPDALALLDKIHSGLVFVVLVDRQKGWSRTVTGTLAGEQRYLNSVNRVYRIDDETTAHGQGWARQGWARGAASQTSKNSPAGAVRAATPPALRTLRAERSQLDGANKAGSWIPPGREANGGTAVALYAQILHQRPGPHWRC